MKTINEIEILEEHLRNEKYNFQPKLTPELDAITFDFDQKIINQIVLWKVNRYVEIKDDTFSLLNSIKKEDANLDIDLTKKILKKLLSTNGIQLSMASTILRFKNPKIYQIIDQRVYRFIYGEKLPKHFSTIKAKIELYLEYLQKLRSVCEQKGINYELSDRIIYELDKEFNKNEKIDY